MGGGTRVSKIKEKIYGWMVSSSETSRVHNYTAHHRLHLKFVEKRQHDPIMAYRLERNGAIDVPFQTRTWNTISVDWLNVLKYTNTLLLPCLQGFKERNWYRLPVRRNNFFFSSFYFVSFIIEIPRFLDWIFQMLRERSKGMEEQRRRWQLERITQAPLRPMHQPMDDFKITKGRAYSRTHKEFGLILIWLTPAWIPLKFSIKMNQMK